MSQTVDTIEPAPGTAPHGPSLEREAAALIRAFGKFAVRIAEQKAIAADYFGRHDQARRWLEVAARAARLLPPAGR